MEQAEVLRTLGRMTMPKVNRKMFAITLAVLLVATVLKVALMFEDYEPL